MPLIDLLSPWRSALDGSAPPQDRDAFHARWHELLDGVRRQRAPADERLPAPGPAAGLTNRASDPSLHQLIREGRDRLAAQGVPIPRTIVLLATTAPGDAVEPIPDPAGTSVVLFLDRIDDIDALLTALARGMIAAARWSDPTASPLGIIARQEPWQRWAASRQVPLSEWIYTEGLGLHAAQLLAPHLSVMSLLGVSRGTLRRLRERERQLVGLLSEELGARGVGPLLRWLDDGAPTALRRTDDGVIPAGAGRYLAWRLVADRVERVGLAEAMRMPAV